MSMIRVENITFSYPSSFDPVFENVSFQIDTEWKLGLVGRNGRGKTTLLKLLLGEYEYRGKITGAVTFDYFPFPVSDKTQMTEGILRQVCQNARQWELIRELSYLGIESEVLWRPFETMSNGEQTKALLAALFLKEEHFLLIDEPTNHLDVEGRRQMADYLKRKRGFILVSHDRYLLDECVDHILSLNRSNIEIQSGNFSSWMENFKKRQNFEINRNESLKKDIRRMKESARQAKVWSDKVESSKRGAADKGYVGHKAAKMMKRSKNAEARKERAAEEKSKLLNNAEYAEMLKITPLMYHSEKLVWVYDFSKRLEQESNDEIIPYLDYAFFSHDRDDEYIRNFMVKTNEKGAKTVVAMLGEYGSLAYENGKFYKLDAEKVEVVNTVGAGDSYIAAFTYGVSLGEDIMQCMRRGRQRATEIIQQFNPYK